MKTSLLKLTVLCTIVFGIGISATAQSIDDLLSGYFAYNRFSGSVLVMQGDKVIFNKSYGFADIEKKIKNDENTIYDLGSVTKTMTAVAILKLHDEGKLSVYDRVEKYIPGFISDSTDKITLINLLNHTSGMSANLGRIDDEGKGLMPGSEPILMDSLIAKFKSSKLKNVPGKKYEYSNYGYTLLAYIIEKVSGMKYEDYLKNVVFSKLSMNSTFYKLNLNKSSAIGYIGIGTTSREIAKDPFHPSWIKGAGYLYSNTVDLAKYINAVYTCQIFSAKTLQLMMDTCINIGKSKRYWALGWEKRKTSGLDFFSHSGGIFGFSTKIGYIPEKNISIIILTNLTKDIKFDDIYSAKFSFVDEITENIIKILNDEKVSCLPVPKGKATKSLSGIYKFDEKHIAKLYLKADSLFLSMEKSDNYSLFDYNFYKDASDSSINSRICNEFAKALLSANFEGFDQYASDEMKKALFNPKGFNQINTIWKTYLAQSGEFRSYNICNKSENNYSIAFHFEKTEIVMQLSFNGKDLIQGLFFQKVVPKCTVYNVSLIPVGNDEFFVDGYTYGGYNDYRVKFDKNSNVLNFKSETEDFTAIKND